MTTTGDTESREGTGVKRLDTLSVRLSLPRLSGVGAEVLSVMHQPASEIDMRHLASLVESDPTLVVAVLRTANSAYFGALREITTVSQAIMRMGMEDTMHILTYYCLRGLLPSSKDLPNFSSKQFWLHSWAAATAARMLGRPEYLTQVKPAELYTAGLLHDIGKVVFVSQFGEAFDKACMMAAVRGMPIRQAELEAIGLDHAAVGGKVLDDWNLPVLILDAVKSHHDPAETSPEAREMVALIELADAIAHQSGFGDGTHQPAPDPVQCAIAQHSTSPLSEPRVLQRVVEETTVGLIDKSKILHRQKQPARLGDEPPRSGARPRRSAAQAQPQPGPPRGLWGRIVTWAKSFKSPRTGSNPR